MRCAFFASGLPFDRACNSLPHFYTKNQVSDGLDSSMQAHYQKIPVATTI
jgi:hypothetical protein